MIKWCDRCPQEANSCNECKSNKTTKTPEDIKRNQKIEDEVLSKPRKNKRNS